MSREKKSLTTIPWVIIQQKGVAIGIMRVQHHDILHARDYL